METNQFFGGTDATVAKMEAFLGTINVDGTNYKVENWLKEVAVMAKLVPGKDQVWIPYGGAEFYGTLKEVDWTQRYSFKNYQVGTKHPETADWFISTPVMVVTGPNGFDYFVYEYSFYKRIKNKVRTARDRNDRPKRKFLSKEDIVAFKKASIVKSK